jgi:O-antigen/teichoic acid export membrane protein
LKKLIRKLIYEDNFLSLTGNLTIALFGFTGFALLARSFPMEEFGKWVLFIASFAFVEMFRLGITNTAVVRFLSGVSADERVKFIGSNALIGLVASLIFGIILLSCYHFFSVPITKAGYELFFIWYPLLSLVNLPYNMTVVIMQADQKFGKILLIRLMESGSFFVVLVINFFFLKMTLIQIVWSLIVINAFTSLFCIFKGWDGMKHIPKATSESNKTLLHFGKYTTFTLIGTNLLRSTDAFIISLSPLGTAAVALYSIPMKLTELQQIPLRSFAATAFPKMSKASIKGHTQHVKDLFYTYSGAITYLFVFVSIFVFIFADLFVLVLGGRQYLGVDPVTGFNATTIVRIFTVYGLLIPIDRMTGLGLDSVNKPDKNFIKVLCMVIANIIGDLIAIFVFKSLALAAVASIIFTAIGILIGFHFLNKELHLNFVNIHRKGISFYKDMLYYVRNHNNQSPSETSFL